MAKTTTHDTRAGSFLAEHQELLRKVAGIRTFWQEVCDLGIGPRCNEMADRIADVRRLLREHFAAEVEGGYLNAVLEHSPQFTEQATRLCAQHAVFLETLDGLESRLRAPETDAWNSVCDEVDAFINDLLDHEHRENKMIQTAFNQDESVGD